MVGEGIIVEAAKYAGGKAKEALSDDSFEALAQSWEENFAGTRVSREDLQNILASEKIENEVEKFEQNGDFDRDVLASKIEALSQDYNLDIHDGNDMARAILKGAREELPMETQQKVQVRLLHQIQENLRGSEETGKKISIKEEINFQETERIYSNFFRVIEMPFKVKSAKTDFRNKGAVYDEFGENVPTFIIRENRIFTFSDLTENGNLLRKATNGEIRTEKTRSWINDKDKKYYLLDLLNSYLSSKVYDLDAIRHKGNNKHTYFIPVEKQDVRIDATWDPGKKSTRWVSKPLGNGFVHKAIQAKFGFVDDEVYLILKPTQCYTKDGYNPVDSKLKNKLSSKAQSYDRNKQYSDNVKFWSFFLSEGKELLSFGPIDVYGQPEDYEMSCSRESDYYGPKYYDNRSKVTLEVQEVEQDEG